jgi:hypothetical protein
VLQDLERIIAFPVTALNNKKVYHEENFNRR